MKRFLVFAMIFVIVPIYGMQQATKAFDQLIEGINQKDLSGMRQALENRAYVVNWYHAITDKPGDLEEITPLGLAVTNYLVQAPMYSFDQLWVGDEYAQKEYRAQVAQVHAMVSFLIKNDASMLWAKRENLKVTSLKKLLLHADNVYGKPRAGLLRLCFEQKDIQDKPSSTNPIVTQFNEHIQALRANNFLSFEHLDAHKGLCQKLFELAECLEVLGMEDDVTKENMCLLHEAIKNQQSVQKQSQRKSSHMVEKNRSWAIGILRGLLITLFFPVVL